MIWIPAYIATIVLANIITAGTVPLGVGPFLVPWGTFLIGGTLVLRDIVQLRYGRRASYGAIALALVASAASSAGLSEPLAITAGSAVAFAFSETAETEIFSRFRSVLAARVLWSGTVSSAIDSVLFIVVALSPLTTGIVPWAALPLAIAGQYLVKTLMVSVGAAASLAIRPRVVLA